MNQQKGFANIILVVVIVILVGVVGYFAFVKKSEPVTQQLTPTSTSTQTKTPAPTPTKTTTPTPETVSWKTYTNNRVSYQFDYPASGLKLAIDETIKYPSTRTGDSKTEDLVQFATNQVAYSVGTEIGIKHNSVESWIQDTNVSHIDGNISSYTKISVGGKIAYTSNAGLATYVYNNGNIYMIIARAGIAPSVDKNDSIYSHLLSTFKFTN